MVLANPIHRLILGHRYSLLVLNLLIALHRLYVFGCVSFECAPHLFCFILRNINIHQFC